MHTFSCWYKNVEKLLWEGKAEASIRVYCLDVPTIPSGSVSSKTVIEYYKNFKSICGVRYLVLEDLTWVL